MDLEFDLQALIKLLLPLGIFVGVFLAGLIVRKVLLNRLTAWVKRSRTPVDQEMIETVRTPFMIWTIMLGIYIAIEVSRLPENLTAIAGKALMVLGVLSVTIVCVHLVNRLIHLFSSKIETALPVTSVTTHLTRIVIFAIGILIILNALGISITPILATLGVGGLAVALALQDTLSNMFSGLHITMARQIRIGDYIKLDSGEEGYVIDINWRTTKIRMLPNNVVLVPNSKLAQAIVVNYYLPDRQMAVLVDLGVHYKSDLGFVERVTCEVAQQVMKEVPGAVPDFEPFIRYHTFDASGINFTVILRIQEFADQHLVKHEFVKRLQARYNKEGICIPFPIRAINYEQEGAGKK